MFAVNMLVNTESGDTFSFNEIKRWLEEAGFKKKRARSKRPGDPRWCWRRNRNDRHGKESASHEREGCFDSNVKKAKTKRKKGPVRGSVERRVPYQKAAIRSSAFTRALLNAGAIGAIRIGCAHFLKSRPKSGFDSERAIQRFMALFTSDAAADPGLFSRRIPERFAGRSRLYRRRSQLSGRSVRSYSR